MKKSFVIYFGVLQAVHIIFLIVLLTNTSWVFGFLNNFEVWHIQFVNMFKAISIIDLLNALASLYFVDLFIKKKPFAQKLGIIVLSISVYSALIFGMGIQLNNLQKGNELLLIAFSIPFLPVFYFWWKMITQN